MPASSRLAAAVEFAVRPGQGRQSAQGAGARHALLRRRVALGGVQELLQQAASCGEMAVPAPEKPERGREAQRPDPIADRAQPGEGSPQIRVLGLQPIQPDRLLGAVQGGLGPLGQIQVVRRVGIAGGGFLPAGGQLLPGELLDRLQHREAQLAVRSSARCAARLWSTSDATGRARSRKSGSRKVGQ